MPGLCIIPSRALADDELTGTDLRALLAVGHFTSRDGTGVWASNATLAEVANIDARHLQRSLRVLEDRGYVRRVARPGTTSLLAIVLDDPFPGGGAKSAPPGGAKSAPSGGAESAPQTTHRTTHKNDSSSPAKKTVEKSFVAEHHRAAYLQLVHVTPAARTAIDYELHLVAEGGERPGVGMVAARGWARVGEALHQLLASGRAFSSRSLGTFLDGLDPAPTVSGHVPMRVAVVADEAPDPLALVGL